MPTIRVDLFPGRSVEQKRALARALTDACVATLGGSADAVDVILTEIERHHWATAGTLWSDRASSAASAAAASSPPAGRAPAAPSAA